MNVLITGGAGYIGSVLTYRLLEHRHHVTVFDNLSTGVLSLVSPNANFVRGDILDTSLVHDVLVKNKIDLIIHLAGLSNVAESVSRPEAYYQNNVIGTESVINAATKSRIKKIIFSSTASIYNSVNATGLISEDDQIDPKNPYAFTKWECEKRLLDWATRNQSFCLIFRFFNVAGSEHRLLAGEKSLTPFHLIKLACQSMVSQSRQIRVNGTDYITHDGTCVRDYVHVEDIADAMIRGMIYLDQSRTNQILNLGSGVGASVKEVLFQIEKLAGETFIKEDGPRRPGDVAYLVSNIEKAKRILEWIPKNSDLPTICQSALDWEEKIAVERGPAKIF